MRNFKTPALPESPHHNNIFLKKFFPGGFELAGHKHSYVFLPLMRKGLISKQ